MSRRYFLCMGTSDYATDATLSGAPEYPVLVGVQDELQTVAKILRNEFGYLPAMCDPGPMGKPDKAVRLEAGVFLNPARELFSEDPDHNLAARWFMDPDRRPSDVLILYYTGHGEIDRATSQFGIVPTHRKHAGLHGLIDPCHLLVGCQSSTQPPRHVLFILDTCHSGAALERLGSPLGALPAGCSVRFLPASRPEQAANQGAFAGRLSDVAKSISLLDRSQRKLPYSTFIERMADALIPDDQTLHHRDSPGATFDDYFPLALEERDWQAVERSVTELVVLLSGDSVARFRRHLPRHFRTVFNPVKGLAEANDLREALLAVAQCPVDGQSHPLLYAALALAQGAPAQLATDLMEWVDSAIAIWATGVDRVKTEALVAQAPHDAAAAEPLGKLLCRGQLDREGHLQLGQVECWLDYKNAVRLPERLLVIPGDVSQDPKQLEARLREAMELAELSLGQEWEGHLHFILPARLIEHPVELLGEPISECLGAHRWITVSAFEREGSGSGLSYNAKKRRSDMLKARDERKVRLEVARLAADLDAHGLLKQLRSRNVYAAIGSGNGETALAVVQSGIPFACWSRLGSSVDESLQETCAKSVDVSDWPGEIKEYRSHDAHSQCPCVSLVLFMDDRHHRPPTGSDPFDTSTRPSQFAA